MPGLTTIKVSWIIQSTETQLKKLAVNFWKTILTVSNKILRTKIFFNIFQWFTMESFATYKTVLLAIDLHLLALPFDSRVGLSSVITGSYTPFMSSQTQPCWDELPKVDLQEGTISIAPLNNSFSKFVARMLHL